MENTSYKPMVQPWLKKWQSPFQYLYGKLALLQKSKENKRIFPFVTQYHLAVPNAKQILMKDWHLIEQQRKKIYKDPPLICYKRGRSFKDILVRAKL